MKPVANNKSMKPEEYLLKWLGLVGGCINLSLPSRLFGGGGNIVEQAM